jgi:hypothetical protein
MAYVLNTNVVVGTNKFSFVATATSAWISLATYSTQTCVFDNVSVKAIIDSPATSYMPSSLTFTSRGSTATYFDKDGVLQTAAANVARYTYEPSNLSAQPYLLLEAAATNYMYGSQSFTGWSGSVSVGASASSYRGVPYMTLSKTTTSSSESLSSNAIAISAGNYVTLTIALRAGSVTLGSVGIYDTTGSTAWGAAGDSTCVILEGPNTVAIAQNSGGLFNVTGLSTTVDTVVAVTRKYPAAGSIACYIYPGTPGSVTVGHSILATRVQMEDGRVSTSYIPTPTTAWVSRSADVYTSSTGSRAIDNWSGVVATRAADTPMIRNNLYSTDIPLIYGDTTTKTVSYSYGGAGSTIPLPAPNAVGVMPWTGDVVADPKLDPVTYAPLSGSPLLDTSWRDNIRMFNVPMALSDA